MMNYEELERIPFVFIVGRGRSGTTLLQNIIDANEHVLMPIESRLIIYLKQKYFTKVKWTENDILQFIDDIYLAKKFEKYWDIERKELKKRMLAIPIQKINFNLLCKIVYTSYKSPYKKSTIHIIGDKNPIYSIFVKDLLEIFPEAKFIHLVRDYRDNVLSNVKVIKTESIPIASHGWICYNQKIEKIKNKNPSIFLTIKYEDLVTFPEETTKKICNFLPIEFSQKMLEFNKVVAEKIETKPIDSLEEMNDFHPNLTKPVNTNQINKWKKAFTDEEVLQIEFIAGEYGKKYSYQPSLERSTKINIKIVAAISYLRHSINYFIIKIYYKSPQKLRELTSNFSKFLFKTLNYTNYFNKSDFRYVENKKK